MTPPGTIPPAWRTAAQRNWFAKAAAVLAPPEPPSPPAIPKPPKPSTKQLPALDPRTDKPEGMNLMQGVQTVSNSADIGSSYTAFGRRLQGNPA